MSNPAEEDAYSRGHLAGEIAARLAGHDAHFAAINGHLAELVAEARSGRERHASETRDLVLAIQRLEQQAVASAATVVTTAAALKDAEEARRTQTEQSWSPIQRLLAVLGTAAAVVGTAAVFFLSR